MARNCSADAAEHDIQAGYVDLGVAPSDVHTHNIHNPDTAVSAFLDFLLLMDASVIVRTKSSFSGMICSIKGLKCYDTHNHELSTRMVVCLPQVCTI